MFGQLAHALVEFQEGVAQALDLLVGERSVVHPAERLTLHQLPEQLDQREHQLGESLLDLLGIGVHAAREGLGKVVELACDPTQVGTGAHVPASVAAKEYGAHGPVQTTATSGEPSAPAAASRKSSTFSSSTRYAALISPPAWR